MKLKDKPQLNKSKMQDGLVPRLRFPEFRDTGEWGSIFGDDAFDQINNKNHNSDLPILAITQEHGAIPRDMIDYQVFVADKSIESYKVVEVGDFIISLRSFQGGIEYSRFRGICSPAYVILRLRKGNSADYFRHNFKTERFINQMTKNIEGLRDGKMVSYKQFSELSLPTPSLPEQQRIADCLSSLDERITAEAQKLDALKVHKKGLMQKLFPAEGQTFPCLRFPEFQDAGEWNNKKLGEVILSSPDYGINAPAVPYSEILPTYLRITDISDDGLFLKDKRVSVHARVSDKNYLQDGDIVFARTGASVGKVYRYDQKDGPLVFAGFLIRIRPDKENVSSSFLSNIFSMMAYRRWVEKTSPRSGQPGINSEEYATFGFSHPSLPEQQRIADCLSSLDDLITAQVRKVELLRTHKKVLMQQLFPMIGGAHGEV